MTTMTRFETAAPARLAAGFAAAALSHLTVQTAAIAAFYAACAPVPFPPWSTAPVPPLGVPVTLSAAFWGGLWGAAYAALEPRLTARLGWWRGGLAFGALPLLALWFVALPLKGLPVGGGFAPSVMLVAVVLHAVFGLGTAAFFRAGLRLAGRGAPVRPGALPLAALLAAALASALAVGLHRYLTFLGGLG
jgi:hypothetical protein